MNLASVTQSQTPITNPLPKLLFNECIRLNVSDLIRQGEYMKAYNICLPHAQEGSVEACYTLGIINKEAVTNEQFPDFLSAANMVGWLRTASDQGHLKARFELGMLYFKREEYGNAYRCFRQFSLGNLNSSHVKTNNPNQGSPLTLTQRIEVWRCLEKMHEKGLGVERSQEKASDSKFWVGRNLLLQTGTRGEGERKLQSVAEQGHTAAKALLKKYGENPDYCLKNYQSIPEFCSDPALLRISLSSTLRRPMPLPQHFLNRLTSENKASET